MDSFETVIPKIREQLCEDSLPGRVAAWGPAATPGGNGFIHSWTDTVSKDIGSTRHYITCYGEFNGQLCLGRWSRRHRETLSPGLYCILCSHVVFDDTIISEKSSPGKERTLKNLRHSWAEHVLNPFGDEALTDGSSTNGASTNGASTNGASTNGASTNGASTNGAPTNGAPTNDPLINTSSTNGTFNNEVTTDGLSTNGSSTNGSTNGNGIHHSPKILSGGPLVGPGELDMMRAFLEKAIARSAAPRDGAEPEQKRTKTLGKGTGGRAGVTEDGVVMKRDSGDSILGNGQDQCYKEPGGYFRSGDLEVWNTWHGWSSLGVRDGRWRPGFHFEILLGLFTTIIDYGTNRKLWRAREKSWVIAAEWIWQDTPNDVHALFAEGVVKDLAEIYRREVGRLKDLSQSEYKADTIGDRDSQTPLLLDRGGEYIARHLVGQPLVADRGYMLAWILCIPNDIQDYERDVLGGETSNLVRGLASSTQQVVDAAYMFLLLVEGAYAHGDMDMVDASMGVSAYFTLTWRYNTSKQFHLYEAVNIRDRKFGSPAELDVLLGLVQKNYPTNNNLDETYGELWDRVISMVAKSYVGCTCDLKPQGHDAWKLLRQALDEGINEEVEEQAHLEFSHLSIGASNGDIRCECGLDLMGYEGFTRFYNPDEGLVTRLHHKTSTSNGNGLAE